MLSYTVNRLWRIGEAAYRIKETTITPASHPAWSGPPLNRRTCRACQTDAMIVMIECNRDAGKVVILSASKMWTTGQSAG